MKVPFSPPDITEEDIQEVVAALRSGWITTGPKTKQLEAELTQYCGSAGAVCLNSATACLETVLRVLGIGPGDEVITCAYTYTASASVIVHVGATPVLVDVDQNSYFLSAKKMAEAITEKTKAIIPIDLAGVPADYNALYAALETKKHLYRPSTPLQSVFNRPVVLADAAHSIGASYQGQRTGSLADFSCFSFHAVKNLTTAEGGAITWKSREGLNNQKFYQQCMLFSLHGQNKDALAKTKQGGWKYDIQLPGYKCNMTDMAAGLGLSQLHRYGQILARRKALADRYDRAFYGHPALTILAHQTKMYESSRHLYVTRVAEITETARGEIIEQMAQAGIAANVHYIPLPMHTAYRNLGFTIADYPNAFAQYQNEITLPLFSTMTDEQQDYVIEHYLRCLKDYC